MASARTPGQANSRIHPRRHNQDPDAVSSRHRSGAAATSGPLHQCSPAPVAVRAPERDPGGAAGSKGLAGSGRHASGLGGVADGPDDALHLAARTCRRCSSCWCGTISLATRRRNWWCGSASMASCRSTRLWAAAGSTWRSRLSACSSAGRSTGSIRTAPRRSDAGLNRPRGTGMSSRPRLSGPANASSGGGDPVAH